MKKFVSLSTGMRIEYVEQGKADADGVPVIFLHGVTDSWRSFERVLPQTLKVPARVWREAFDGFLKTAEPAWIRSCAGVAS